MKRILVFHGGALGDLVNTLPALAALRSRYQPARITAVGNRSFLSLFQAAGVIDQALSLDRAGFHSLFGDSTVPDEVADLLHDHDLAVTWIRSLRLRERLLDHGLEVAAMTDPFPPPSGSGHVVEWMARPLRALGIDEVSPYPRLGLAPSTETPGFRGLLIHPGSGSRAKNWPARRFAEAARVLASDFDLPVAFLEGPADANPAAEFARAFGPKARRFADLDLENLARLLAGPALVIGNDSGVCHLAGAMGAPTIAVFGPTDPAVWGVRQPHVVNLAPRSECAPCPGEVMSACADRECLESVTVEQVVEAAKGLLQSRV